MDANVSEFSHIGDILVLPLFEGTEKAPNNALNGLSRTQRSLVNEALASESFTGKNGKHLSVWTPECRVVLVGMGECPSDKECRDGGAKTLAALSKDYGTNITVRFTTGWTTSMMALFAEGMILRDYDFDKYLQKNDDENQGNWSLDCQASRRHQEILKSEVSKSVAITKGVHMARELGNEPANIMYPEEFARRATEWAKDKSNVEIEVWDYARLQKEGMHGVIAVGKGSERKPCMVFFRLNPTTDKNKQVPCIVGKGITFDTGGISIKPSAGMWDMKFDMHGSATVFGLFVALYESGYKGRVNGITCMAENMPSAGAYRPGDIIDTYSGKTIEVLNTDAEGRNVLADGLWKSAELDPSYIVDLATLTGACVVALGHEASGLWSNNDELSARIHAAGNAEDEIAWPMPLLPAF
ncbi:MAG: M17 family peptidase N-terminal domain-containing protein, partial [Candidatus Thermoplasmatota archaeon]|nr:M17 family peptidase N-terminal domain-containing protein [Candidatus Thermoplasmatota archaeon]